MTAQSTLARPDTRPAPAEERSRRGWALAVIALAQLLVVLDATVINVALPDAQRSLGMSDSGRQWVITLYALTFGGLLLLGGRIADFWGRRRTFIVGTAGFAAASVVGGLAQSPGTLIGARAVQGAFAAMLAPAALSLLQVTFPSGAARNKAFAVYGAIGGGGSAFGLVIGGVLTQYASWRWCLLVNVPVAVIAIAGALRYLSESKADGDAGYDIPGAVAVSLGLGSLVYGFTQASRNGWASAETLGFLGAAVVLLGTFAWIENRVANPLLPLRVPLHPTRGGAYLTSLIGGAALLGGLLFLSYYFQLTLHYSPLRAGLATVPLAVAVLVAAALATPLVDQLGPKPLMVIGPVIAAAGLFSLTSIGAHSAYLSEVLPGQLLIGLGLGLLFVPLSSVALTDVTNHDTGAASGLVNATQQVGGAIGTALFSTLYSSAVRSYVSGRDAHDPNVAVHSLLHGYDTAFSYAAGLMLVAGVIACTLIRVRRDQARAGQPRTV